MTATERDEYVTLGALGAPYGIKGWVKLISFTEPADNILAYRHFSMKTPAGLRPIEIVSSRAHGNGFVAQIRGCDDRDQTRMFTGNELLVPKDELPPLSDDEFYWHELIGLKVFNLRGEELGSVSRMMETGANDVLVVTPSGERPEGEKVEDILIPFIQEQIIRSVDIAAGRMDVDWEADY